MNVTEHLAKIKDVSFKRRYLLVDDLSDLFQSGQILESTAVTIIEATIKLLEIESDIEVIESIFNLFVLAVIENDFCQTAIVETTVKHLPTLEVGSLCHAFVIISESHLPNKQELLIPYLASDNRIIREMAREELLFCQNISTT